MEATQTQHRGRYNALSFFMSCLGIAFIASIYILFVFFEDTIPSRYETEVDISKYDFFSYILSAYFHYWQWLSLAIFTFSFVITLFWMKYKSFSISNVFGLVLFVGSVLAALNFRAHLVVGWFPYSLLLLLTFWVSTWYGVKLCNLGGYRYALAKSSSSFGKIMLLIVTVFLVIYGVYIYNEFPPKLQYIYSDSPLKG